ncbi:MAG: acetyl-CoA carboxylase biotin carboxylase subunit, partial [Puniceicoccales bacterium]|nr:acetyl-CoA carboxylase biotin carboxylase subunit [Puniceicoccales bacterium]
STRTVAIDRMYRALKEYIIRGVHTTIPFSQAVMLDPNFREGKVTTRFVEEFTNRIPEEF